MRDVTRLGGGYRGAVDGERETRVLERADLVPTRRSSVLSLLSLRKLSVDQDLISEKQWGREDGGRAASGLLDR